VVGCGGEHGRLAIGRFRKHKKHSVAKLKDFRIEPVEDQLGE